MSDIERGLARIRDMANQLFQQLTASRQQILTQEQEHVQTLLAQYNQACESLRAMFAEHGFTITTNQFHIPEIPSITKPQIQAAHTVSGFTQVWAQLLNTYVKQDSTPQHRMALTDLQAKITQEIARITDNRTRYASVFTDTYFMASVHACNHTQSSPSLLLWQMMRDEPLSDHPVDVCVPHSALLQWHLQQSPHSAYAPYFAWYSTFPLSKFTEYMEVLNLMFHDTTTQQAQSVVYDQWPIQPFRPADWQPLLLPSSVLDTDRLRARRHGNVSRLPYTIAYSFIPNDFSVERKYESEDALLFEVDGEDFIVIVSDGVSQSCMGNIGSRSVTQMLYITWQELRQHPILYDETHLNRAIKRALYTAKIDANTKVSQKLYADEFKDSVSERIWRVLESLYKEGGTQSTFSCVFRIGSYLYAINMGNSGILIQGDSHGVVLHPQDERFTKDSIRFSSGERTGMRGEPFISVYPEFLAKNTSWRIVIHSDALLEYTNLESLYLQPLTKPTGRALNFDDDLLNVCTSVDDTTIIEFYYAKN